MLGSSHKVRNPANQNSPNNKLTSHLEWQRSVIRNYRRTRSHRSNMAKVEQSFQALNLQLSEANAQIRLMSVALDTLRTESVAAVMDLRRQLASTTSAGTKAKDVNFINTKVSEGGE